MLNAFGRNYEEIGSSDKGLILKNSGKVKIQWGKSLIDLLDNNGKLNVKVEKLIKEVSSEDNITEDGFYFINGSIKVKVGEKIMEVAVNSNSTFISFLSEQDISSEEKFMALKNIGFVYENISKDNIYPKNGIIYSMSDQSLYIIANNTINKYYSPIPSFISHSFTISNSQSDSNGALIIKGEGKNNSIFFDTLQIYSNDDQSYIDGKSKINFKVNDINVLTLTEEGIKVNKIEAISDSDGGFQLYNNNGKYQLEIDTLKVRDNLVINETLIPQTIYSQENIISKLEAVEEEAVEAVEEEVEGEVVEENENIEEEPSDSSNEENSNTEEQIPENYRVTLKYKNTYSNGDKIRFYIDDDIDGIVMVEGTVEVIENSEDFNLKSLQFTSKQCGKPLPQNVTPVPFNLEKFYSSLNKVQNIPCFLVGDLNLVIGELDDINRYKENNKFGIISKQNIFYSANFKKDGQTFSQNNYPFYDENLTSDLLSNLNETTTISASASDNILVPVKLFRILKQQLGELTTQLSQLDNRVSTLENQQQSN